MNQHTEATLAFWSEQRQQLRQSENQRAILTNYILVTASAISGLIVQQKFAPATLPLAMLVILIGVYGALSAAKYHERAEYHLAQARALTRALEEAGDLPDDARLREYREAHYLKYPRLHRLRLHALWTGLHVGVAVYGLALGTVVLARISRSA